MTKYRIRGVFMALLATTLAAGCKTTPDEPKIVTREVLVQTPVPCPALAELGEEPNYPDTDAALAQAPSVGVLAQLYRIGRALRIQRLQEYIAAREACTTIPE